ncbi:MAG: Ca-activated chloride channel [Blastocatellia bacterium]|jgi:VWFA-related protein|nr:Ca-activated chloride channel [Blastocatellia bacterium]
MTDFRFAFRCPLKKPFVAALALLLFCALASTQSALAQDGSDDPIRIDTSLVQLNVGVVDRQGRAVTTLSPKDFAVYEEGVRQTIQSFEPVNSPFSLVLLLDMSGSTLSFRATLKQAAIRFIDALAPEDRVAVIAFNDKVKTLAGFSNDYKKIAYAIQYADGKGGTEFYQALAYSLSELGKETKRRKAIVVLTDGIDTQMGNKDRAAAAGAQTNDTAIAAIKPDASGSLNAVLNAADRQGVTIYPLALPSGDPKRIADPSPQQMAVYTSARSRLQKLADRTGGRLNEIRRLEDLGYLYAEVAADLRSLYTITYRPASDQPRSAGWRAIRIEVAHPELVARTRPGYFAR